MKAGKPKRPSVLAASEAPLPAATSIRFAVPIWVQTTSPPSSERTSFTCHVALTGTATRAPGTVSAARRESTSSAVPSSITTPSSSTRVSCSPSEPNTAPIAAPEDRTRSATAAAEAIRSKAIAPAVDTIGFIASTSAPILESTLGMTRLDVPKP